MEIFSNAYPNIEFLTMTDGEDGNIIGFYCLGRVNASSFTAALNLDQGDDETHFLTRDVEWGWLDPDQYEILRKPGRANKLIAVTMMESTGYTREEVEEIFG